MFDEILRIFRPGNALGEMGENFTKMLSLANEMTRAAGEIYFREVTAPEVRSRLYESDVEVNRLERLIRKQVVAHLATRGNTTDVPYCLLLMSLVKDVERVGDYTKNLGEVLDIYSGDLPDDDIVGELKAIRHGVEEAFQAAATIFAESDREQALAFLRKGKDYARRSDGLLARIVGQDYDAGKVAALVLGARYYKRIGGHLLNVLSSVVMPLHKIDYYDEDEVKARAHRGRRAK